jgi:transglutaminase-like putative cysteine protease
MALYQIKYQTENYYDQPVHEAYLEFMIIPCNNENQFCTSYSLKNNNNIPYQIVNSLYGFRICRYHLFGQYAEFNLTLTASVEKSSFQNNNYKNITINEEQRLLNLIENKIEFKDFLAQTALTNIEKNLYPTDTAKASNEPVFKYIQRINNFIQYNMQYEIGITNSTTTANEALQIKKGVCQDFAHIFISIMRTNNIPARYVSGYLNQNGEYTGSLAMHAWVEVWLPGTGWIGIDPTNNLFVNDNYLKVAHGADYNDCMSLRGIIRSGSKGTTNYFVEVTEQQNQ